MKRLGAFFLACVMLSVSVLPTGAGALTITQPHERGIPPDWAAEHIYGHTFANMGSRSLAIDADDHLYLAYGGDHLYFTHNDGSGWATPQIIDPDWGVGQGVSLALDTNHKVHISYIDTSSGGLRYATNQSGAWVITMLLTGIDIGLNTALALDYINGQPYPHILYYAPQADALGYEYLQANGIWTGYGVNNPGFGGAGVHLAIGGDHRLQISYYQVKDINSIANGCMDYQVKDAVLGWQPVSYSDCSPLSAGGAGSVSAIGLDANNYPHIAFNVNGALRYVYYPGGGGSWKVFDTSGGGLDAISIVVEGTGQTYIAYDSHNQFKYAVHDLTQFTTFEVIDTASMVTGNFVSLVMDSSAHPRAVYLRKDTGSLLYSQHTSGASWQAPVTIDQQLPAMGACTQLDFSSNGTAHLTYYDPTAKRIYYVSRPAGGSWSSAATTINPASYLNCQHAMKVNNDVPSIAYTTDGRELRYATYNCPTLATCSWNWYHVADNVYLPESVSLAFTSDHHPRISFIQNNTPTLALNDGSNYASGWVLSAIDYDTASGQTSLAIGSDNKARVAFFRSSSASLYYIVQDGTNPVSWHTPPMLVDSNNAGKYVALALTSTNWARVAYTGSSGSPMRYSAQYLIGGWLATPVTLTSASVESPALILDSYEQPHIFYYSENDQHLHQAYQPGSSWVFQLLDGNAEVGSGLAVAVSPLNGKPALSYFDENNSGVKYITQINVDYVPLVKK